MKTTCLYCGLPTQITPDATRCTECGGDLEALIVPEYASDFYYQQAQEQAFQGDAKQAIATIRRGLDEYDSPDLHLLAAILHQRMSEFDQMRAHVAAIPIDDALRPEGEWLLRSHQARQRGGRRRSVQTNNDTLAMTPFGQPEGTRTAPANAKPSRRAMIWAVPTLAVLLAVAGFFSWQNGMLDAGLQQLGFAGIPGLTQNAPVSAPAVEQALPAASSPAAAEQTILPTPTPLPTPPPPDDVVQAQDDSVGIAASTDQESAPVAAETAAPETAAAEADNLLARAPIDDTGIDDTGEAEAAPSPVASSDEASVASLAALPEIDLALLLSELDAAELSNLPITANRRGSEVILTGTTQTAEQRERIIELLASVPGVRTVDALNLVVRVADTYTTQRGDNLWNIAETLYGDGRRWREIYELNRDLLGLNPQSLYADIELQLPVQ